MILGVISIVFSVVLYVFQEVVKSSYWAWYQVFSMETAVSIALFVGIVLLVVGIVELIWKKKRGK